MKVAAALGLAMGVLVLAPVAAADEAAATQANKGEATTIPVDIHGRRQMPNTSITVIRVPMESTLARLKQPLVERIAKAAAKAPF